jgi:hypothetical protein
MAYNEKKLNFKGVIMFNPIRIAKDFIADMALDLWAEKAYKQARIDAARKYLESVNTPENKQLLEELNHISK